MRLRHTHRRAGFTLVEMLVAAGLTLLIMTVLASGFQAGLQSLSHLKSAADLADRLRNAEALLRLDMNAEHFDGGGSPGILRPSDLRFDRDPTVRPLGGFVQIRQGTGSAIEGIDQDSLTSTRALTHGLSMTVRRQGRTPGELFAAVDTGAQMGTVIGSNPADVAPAGYTATMFMSDWAEVHWFLDLNRPTVQNGVTTYPLCRRVRLLTKNQVPNAAPPPTAANPLADVVSADPRPGPTGTGNTNTLATIANPVLRLGGGGTPASIQAALPNPPGPNVQNPRYGDDIVITNVVSFEVKPTWESVPATTPLPRINAGPVGSAWLNADYPFDDFPVLTGQPALTVFDTNLGGFSSAIAVAPTPQPTVFPARITGAQIKIRVYDGKNLMARQSVVSSKW